MDFAFSEASSFSSKSLLGTVLSNGVSLFSVVGTTVGSVSPTVSTLGLMATIASLALLLGEDVRVG
jgi:hypothetical protein